MSPIASIRLPCGCLIDEPTRLKTHHITCSNCGRQWLVQYKGGEFLAREEET